MGTVADTQLACKGIGFAPGEGEDLLKLLGSRIRQLRAAAGMSLRELGSKSKLDNSKIAKMEKGQINITYLTLCAICEGLGIPLHDFLNF